ncbi:MAG: TspO/MBR family protein [Gemmatimonas sp.]
MHSYSASAVEPQPHRSHALKLAALVALVAITAVAAAIGSIASIQAPEFYLALNRPSWAPPPNLFGPVWSALYLLMAIGAWIVVRVEGWERAKPAMMLYGAQLACNALWTWLFFYWHSGAAAFVDILALCALVVATIVVFGRAHKLAGALLLPYLAWVSFATALTWAVWHANPATL